MTAETHFWAVVDAYKAGNASLGQLAADAYAGLGTIAVFRKDTGGAIEFYRQAAEEAAPLPSRKAAYYRLAGDLYAKDGKSEAARKYYDKAMAVARQVSDQISVDEIKRRIEALGQ